MKHRWRTGAAGVLAALMMTTSAGAVGAAIEINGTSLGAGEAWIENGTSYVTLAAFSRETGRSYQDLYQEAVSVCRRTDHK